MKQILAAILPLILLSSCYSYKIYPAEYRKFENKQSKRIVVVENPELKKEYRILKKSGIFEIRDDAPPGKATRIKLYPLQKGLACGQPILASAFTLGQLPVYLPDRYQFKFEEINQTDTTSRQFELRVAKRVWFWDMFTFDKNFEKKSAQALLASYYHSLQFE